mgnify:CR=1 FL=1
MTYHPRLSEQLTVVGRIKPQSVTATQTATSDIVDMAYHARLMVLVNLGDYAAGNDGSVAVALYSDSASNMATEADITGKALTTGSFTGSAGDDAVGIIELTAEELAAIGQTQRYVRLKITPTNQNMTVGAILLADHSRYAPAEDFDLTKVKEIIA